MTTQVKVGHTTNLDRRLYHLRWGNLPSYAPAGCHMGRYVCIVDCNSKADAMDIERRCQKLLTRYRLKVAKASRAKQGGKPEWFDVPPKIAAKALVKAAKATGNAIVITNLLDLPLFDLT